MGGDDAPGRGEPPTYRHEFGPEKPYAVAVVEAVAEATGIPPASLPELLHEAVDGDALEQLLYRAESDQRLQLRVSFQFCDHLVTLSPDRTVVVTDVSRP